MPIMALILTIENIIGLVQRGLTTAKAVKAAVDAGKMAVIGAGQTELSAADVESHVDAAIAATGAAGDAAAARIEGRPRG